MIDSFNDEAEKLPKHFSLRGRDLKYSILDRSDFTGADFTGTRLDGSRLDRVTLKNAKFGCGVAKRSRLSELAINTISKITTLIRRSSEDSSDSDEESCSVLSYGSFSAADFEGTTFRQPNTLGAIIDHVQFDSASMENVNLSYMDLTGVSFFFTKLGKANLSNAKILSVSLKHADLKESIINNSILVFSDLSIANFTGASLLQSKIVLSDAEEASFIGADLSGASFYGSFLARSYLWGAKAPDIKVFALADLSEAKLDPSEIGDKAQLNPRVEINRKEIDAWKARSDHAIFFAARKALSNNGYKYFESVLGFARSIACEGPVEYAQEIVRRFIDQNSADLGWVYAGSVAPVDFDKIATDSPSFKDDTDKLKKALGAFVPDYNSWYDPGYTNYYADFPYLGKPGIFLDEITKGECNTAKKEPEKWAALIVSLRQEAEPHKREHGELEKTN